MGRQAEGEGDPCSPAGCGVMKGWQLELGRDVEHGFGGWVSAGWICQGWGAGSGGPCPARAVAAVATCSVQHQGQPRQSLLAACCSWIQVLHEGQAGQAATASSVPHHELERNWENSHCEQAAGQPNPALSLREN